MTTDEPTIDTPAEFDAAEPAFTPFVCSLKAMQDRPKAIPAGWRPVFDDAMRWLRGMDCAQRADLCVSGPWLSNGEISFCLSRPDRCVEGLVRRTAARLKARCELCGRQGRMRVLGIRSRVLCAECYAPRALEREVKLLLDAGAVHSEMHSVLFESDLSERVRAFVQDDAWREHRDPRGYVVRYLLREDLREWSGWLSGITVHSGGAAL